MEVWYWLSVILSFRTAFSFVHGGSALLDKWQCEIKDHSVPGQKGVMLGKCGSKK